MALKKVGAGVGVIILKDGKVLLGKRNNDPSKADSELHGEGTWTLPGGGLDFGEDFEECAKREVLEETGLVLSSVDVICINNDKNENAHFVTVGLLSKNFKGEPDVMEPDEITEWKWFSLKALPSPLFFPSERVLECFGKGTFYIKR